MAFLDNTGLEHLWTIIVGKLGQKVDRESGKGLSTNDYTTTEKNKLAGIAEGANKYTLPTASSTLGGVKTTSTVTSTTGLTATPIINGIPYYKDTTYTLSGLGGVPTSRTINGKALTSDITLSASDVGALLYKKYDTGGLQSGAGLGSGWLTYTIGDDTKCQLDMGNDGKLRVNNAVVITVDGGTINGDLYISNDKSTGGYVKLWEDNEGGNIEIGSPNGKSFQIDAYNDTSLRLFSEQNGYKGVSFNASDGYLSADGGFAGPVFKCSRSSGDAYLITTRTDTSNEVYYGIGSGGENRGIWDVRLNRWVFKVNNSGVDLSSMGIIYSATQPTAPWAGAIWLKPI